MYLLYLDASGTPELADTAHASFVLLGLSIHESTWFEVEKRVAELKAKYEFPGIPLELHCLALCSSIREQDEIPDFVALPANDRRAQVLALREQKLASKTSAERQNARRRYRETEAVIHLSRAERSRLYEEALDLVGNHRDIRLFAEIVNKERRARSRIDSAETAQSSNQREPGLNPDEDQCKRQSTSTMQPRPASATRCSPS